MRNKKKNKKMLLLLLLLAISVGFAALATTLKINGSTNITKQTWDIYWDNASIVPTTNLENADITKAAQTKTGDVTTLEWTVNLNLPGDYYEFTVDAVNNGSIDAMITEIDSKIGNSSIISTEEGQLVVADPSPVPSYINYDVTYADGTEIGLNHLLAKKTNNTPTREKYKVRVEYDRDAVENSDIASIPSGGLNLTFTFSVKYGQADTNAVPSHIAKAWSLPQGKTADTLVLGDEICLTDDNTQCFNFIRYAGNDVVMLSKYNLKVGNIYSFYSGKMGEYTSDDPEYYKQSSDARGWIEDYDETFNGTVMFSAVGYWAWQDGYNSLLPKYGDSYPVDIYDSAIQTVATDAYNKTVAYHVEEYKNILETGYGVTIEEARLLTYSEATDSSIGCDGSNRTCPTTGTSSFITNTSFWLGSARNDIDVWYVRSDGEFGDGDDQNPNIIDDTSFGVRPVIVVDKSNL